MMTDMKQMEITKSDYRSGVQFFFFYWPRDTLERLNT